MSREVTQAQKDPSPPAETEEEDTKDDPPSPRNRKLSGLHRHFSGYFRETTVHGFRYVVEGPTRGERASWVAAIVVAFAVAAYLALSAVREAQENPVLTSIGIRQLSQVAFPAVTILAGGEDRNAPQYRLARDVMNAVLIDCNEIHPTENMKHCEQMTKEIRRDFAPLLENTVRAVHQQWKDEIAMKNVVSNLNEWKFNLGGESRESFPIKLYQMLCRLNGSLPNDYDEDELIKVATSVFMMPLSDYEQKILDYVKTNISRGKLNESSECNGDAVATEGIRVFFNTLLTLHMSLQTHIVRETFRRHVGLRLGDLLSYSLYSSRGLLPPARQVLSPNTEEDTSATLPDQILQNFLPGAADASGEGGGGGGAFSAVDLLNVIASERFQYEPTKLTSVLGFGDVDNFSLSGSGGAVDAACGNYFMDDQCRNATKHAVSGGWRDALTVFKYLRQPMLQDMWKTNKRFAEDVERALDGSNYSRRCALGERQFGPHCSHGDALLTSCSFDDEGVSAGNPYRCEVFQPTLTSQGIGYTFNSGNLTDLFAETEAFAALREEVLDWTPDHDLFKHDMSHVEMGTQTKELRFGLRQSFLDVLRNSNEPFRVAIHATGDIATDFIKLSPGYSYTLTVSPLLSVTSDADVTAMPPWRRDCRTRSEPNSTVFSAYTRNSCLVDATLNSAFEFTAFHCVPWDLPRPQDMLVCPSEMEASALKTKMRASNNIYDERALQCLDDCDITTYTYTIKQDKVEPKWTGSRCDLFPVEELHPVLAFLSDPASVRPSESGLWEGACRREARHQATVAVRMRMVGGAVPNVVRKRRVTFTDQMANLGGVIGLFTGMSFLSLVEMLAWIYRGGRAAATGNAISRPKSQNDDQRKVCP